MAVLLLAACSAAAEGNAYHGKPVSGGSLTYAAYRLPDCLDPHVSAADIVGEIQRNVFDSLVAQRSDGSFAPWLATSWQVSPDAMSYTFTLRKNVTFFDGEHFDAQAVKDNFDEIEDPATKSQYAISLLGPYAGTDVLGPYTVRVRFRTPYAPFLQAASTTYLGFYAPNALREDRNQLCAGGPNSVGSGPFREVSYTPGQGVELVRNDQYQWAPASAAHQGPAYLAKLNIEFLTEDATRTGALLGGQVDVAGGLPPAQIQQVQAASLPILRQDSAGAPYSFYFNTSKPPFSDPRARRAVIAAIDVNSIVRGIYFGQYPRAYSSLTPTTPGYDNALTGHNTYNVALANRLLDELGYTGRDAQGYRVKNGRRFTVVNPWASDLNREQRDLVSEEVQQDLKKVGIDFVLKPVDSGTYEKLRNANQYDVIGFSWARDDPDLLSTLFASNQQFAEGGANGAQVHDPQLDALLAQGRATTDPAKRAQAYQQVQQIVLNQAYVLPLYVFPEIYGLSPRVHGLRLDGNGWTSFYDTWVDPS